MNKLKFKKREIVVSRNTFDEREYRIIKVNKTTYWIQNIKDKTQIFKNIRNKHIKKCKG